MTGSEKREDGGRIIGGSLGREIPKSGGNPQKRTANVGLLEETNTQ